MNLINRIIQNPVFFKRINYDLINHIYKQESKKFTHIIDTIMNVTEDKVSFLVRDERAMPSNKEFVRTGYYHKMLGRYFFSGKIFCERKKVLDAGSGVGWGTYIISQYAKEVVALDINYDAIEFSKKTWNTMKVKWIVEDALTMDSLMNEKFDIVLAMEMIEHFSKENGEIYIKRCSERLKNGGFIIGTSTFPNSKYEADSLKQKKPYHPHIFTLTEISEILEKYFSKYKVINNWMFIAKK